MLNQEKSKRIWKNLNIIELGSVRKGKLYDFDTSKKIQLPYIEELAKSAISKLKELGFSVERVEPKKANCIIRVFRDDNIKYEKNTYWMYGVEAYIKTPYSFTSKDDINIDYSIFEVCVWFFQDESTIMKPNFVDYYLRVK